MNNHIFRSKINVNVMQKYPHWVHTNINLGQEIIIVTNHENHLIPEQIHKRSPNDAFHHVGTFTLECCVVVFVFVYSQMIGFSLFLLCKTLLLRLMLTLVTKWSICTDISNHKCEPGRVEKLKCPKLSVNTCF